MEKIYPNFEYSIPTDNWRVILDNEKLYIKYYNRLERTIVSKDYPKETFLYWNTWERELIDYLKRNHIGTYTTKTETNWDEDPYGRKVARGTRTWYYFDFSNLWK